MEERSCYKDAEVISVCFSKVSVCKSEFLLPVQYYESA